MISTRAKMTMPRRSGLTTNGSQNRHLLRMVAFGSSCAPGSPAGWARSVRMGVLLPGSGARTPPGPKPGGRPGRYPARRNSGRGAVVADAAHTARAMWTLFEPIHAVTYFAPEARGAFEQAGLRGFWRGYFAGRAAPLGPAGAAVVTASFFNFAPAFVARAIPGVWELIRPEDALRTRLAGVDAALRGLLAGREAEVTVAADLLWRAVGELDFSGRVLAAANAALPVPDGEASGLARLWQAATLLREHRGDGHFAALVAAGIDGCEAVALRSCMDLRRENLQPVRGWTDEAWDNALARLA